MAAATRPLEAAPSRRPGWPGHPHTRASRARTRGVPAAARPRPSYAAEMLPQAPSYLYSRLKCRGGVVRHSGDDGCRCSAEMPPTGGATVMSRPADVPPTGGAPVPGRTGLIGCGCEAARPRTPGHSRVPPTTSPRPANAEKGVLEPHASSRQPTEGSPHKGISSVAVPACVRSTAPFNAHYRPIE
jgi:hypothetical protein